MVLCGGLASAAEPGRRQGFRRLRNGQNRFKKFYIYEKVIFMKRFLFSLVLVVAVCFSSCAQWRLLKKERKQGSRIEKRSAKRIGTAESKGARQTSKIMRREAKSRRREQKRLEKAERDGEEV
jgi:hypothetical protein